MTTRKPARPRRSRPRALLFTFFSVAAVAVIALGVWALYHRSASRFPVTAAGKPLNVLLVTLDTTRADHIGCYGNAKARTPTLDRLAAEGARFEQASSPAPITLAAHCSIFTGLYPFEHGARGNGEFYLNDRVDTLATVLHKAGYRTAAFVSAFVLDRRYGLARGFDVYDDGMDDNAGGQGIIDIEAERRGDRTVARLSAWLDEYSRNPSAPFLAWLHLYDAHSPYTAPPPYGEQFAGAPYDGEIAFDDALVGGVLGQIDRLGLRDRTMIVVVGDHGESLGDHGEETHSMFVYESAIRVPWMVWRPGLVPAGVVVRDPVRLTDVAPSILDLVGIPGLASRSGRSLVADMRGARSPSPAVYSETLAPQLNMNWAPLRSVRDERWKLIEAPRGELYDLLNDPGEQQNLAGDQPQRVRALGALLADIAGSGAGAMSRAPVDAATRDRLASLGYIGAGSGGPGHPDLAKARDPKDFIAVYNRLNQANRAARERRFAEALPIVREALAADPQNAFAHQTAGDVYLGLGQDRNAIEQYRAYLNLVPPTASVHHLVAVCYLRMGDREKALQEANAALDIDPRFCDARILRGSIFEERGDLDAAIAEFRAATESDPAKAMIRLDLAKVLVEAGRLQEARREYETVLQQHPDFPPALGDLGALSMKQGNLEEAASMLARALAADPSQQEARFNLATLYERQGRASDAASQYRRLLDDTTTPPDLRSAAVARLRAMGR